MKGKKHTKVAKKIMSEKQMGEKNSMYGKEPWNKGLTKEIDSRLREIGKNISKARIGKKHTTKTKIKMSEKHMGKTNKWGHHSEESKRKIREKMKGRNGGKNNPMYGRKHTEEARRKLRERRKFRVFPIKDSSIEVKIQTFLKQLGIEFFTHQYMKEIEHGYQCDILIPSMNMVIECDGDYWHKYPIGNEIDHIRASELLKKGFKVLRLWECEIKIMDLDDFERRLK